MNIDINELRARLAVERNNLEKEKSKKQASLSKIKSLLERLDDRMIEALRINNIKIDFLLNLDDDKFVNDNKYFADYTEVIKTAKEFSIKVLKDRLPNV